MIIIVRQSDQAAEHRRDFWSWCFTNGFSATEVTDPVLVDPERAVITVSRLLPVSQPGDPDFPELRRDEFNRPLTEVRTVPLVAPVPAWMVTQTGQSLAA